MVITKQLAAQTITIMRSYNYTPPADELKQLKSGVKQYINKPTICSWNKGDKIIIEGWKEVTVLIDGHTLVYFGLVGELNLINSQY